MAVRLDPIDVRRQRSRAIAAANAAWVAEQIALGYDGPVPDDRLGDSDYNQHVPEMESPNFDALLLDIAAALP